MALTAKKVYAILKRQISDMGAKLKSPVRYRGTVATADLLPLNPDIGDMYNIESKSVYGEAGMNVAWNGVVWDTMGAPIDMSLYFKEGDIPEWALQPEKPTYTAEETGALPADTKIPSKTSELQNDSGFLTKIPGNYLSGTDKTLSASGKAADAKVTGEKIAKNSSDITKKLDKNQGVENSGKIAGINESGDIVPMFPVGVEYSEKTNCLEFGSDQKMKLNQGIGLDSSLTKTGYAADAGVVGEVTNSLKEDISTKITKFYANSQGETHLADSDNGKIMDMMLYGKSEQKQYSGKNLFGGKRFADKIVELGGTLDESNKTVKIEGNVIQNKVLFEFPDSSKQYTVILSGFNTNPSVQLTNLKASTNLKKFENGISVTTILENTKAITGSYDTMSTVFNYDQCGIFEGVLTYDDFEPYTGGIPSPNPDYPQEIKSVVNPTVKVCGKNLLNSTLQTMTQNGVTCINNGDGTYTLNGTAKSQTVFNLFNINENIYGGKLITGCQPGGGRNTFNIVIVYYTKDRKWASEDYEVGDGKIIKIKNESSYLLSIGILVRTGYVCNNVIFKPMIAEGAASAYEPYHEQTVTLPYTLNAIPVSSGGNVTIDGQQYIADRVAEKDGVIAIERWIDYVNISELDKTKWLFRNDVSTANCTKYSGTPKTTNFENIALSNIMPNGKANIINFFKLVNMTNYYYQFNLDPKVYDTVDKWVDYITKNNVYIYYKLTEPAFEPFPEELQAKLRALSTNYPVTNISITSDQLDGYMVFNYPISMENGWNYVKKQLNDNRDYIYNMDIQSAEAYVNSEYAVALTELEV